VLEVESLGPRRPAPQGGSVGAPTLNRRCGVPDGASLVLTILGARLAVHAQQEGKSHRIGFLRIGPPPTGWIDGLRQGLSDLGYVEGRNIAIEYGLAQSAAQLPDVAAELVRRRVDVLVASGTPSVEAARTAVRTIPVVFVAAIDPVATGVAACLARPGGNVTGVTAMQADLTGKRLELLKQLLPKLSRIALLVRATSPMTAQCTCRRPSLPRGPWERSCKSWRCATRVTSTGHSGRHGVRTRSFTRMTPCSRPTEPG